MGEQYSPDFPDFVQPAVEVWDSLAGWWDDKIGDGNDFQNYLIEPPTGRFLALEPGEKVLDVACGAGRFARRMAALGASVTAIDHSEKFLQRARERSLKSGENITYRLVNATDTEALLSLGEKQFDAAVCTMALMDMACISPLLSTLPRLLKPGGRFVFSVLHPVFNSGTARQWAEQYDCEGAIQTNYGIKIKDYNKPFVFQGIGVPGQPVSQYYFHRPINLLFNTCFKYGFVLDGIEESTFPADAPVKSSMVLSFANMRDIPPIMVARMRIKQV